MSGPNAAGAAPNGPVPKITGPVTGGRGWPLYSYLGDIAQVGYVEEEYFLEGVATRYEPAGALGLDGKWAVNPAGTAPYKTRMIVRRPRDAARFNGTVLLEWINVSAGYDVIVHDEPGLYEQGFVFVGISPQFVSINGLPGRAQPQGTAQWDPARYGSLHHPGDSYCFDIYSQAGRAMGVHRPQGEVDPLHGLAVKRVVGVGSSQSAFRLHTYLCAVEPRDRVYDGYVLGVWFGEGYGFDDALQDIERNAWPARIASRIRDDLQVPVMIVNSETETAASFPVRRPDDPKFRFWEVAGASHVALPMMPDLGAKSLREFGPPQTMPSAEAIAATTVSHVSWKPVVDAAHAQMHRWLSTEQAPASVPPIQVSGADLPWNGGHPQIERDVNGNAVGGVRLPPIEVPIARNDGVGNVLAGHNIPFAPDRLRRLYPTHHEYVAKVTAAAHAAERLGVILKRDADKFVQEAEAAAIPPA